MRLSTSRNPANGSIFASSQEVMKLRSTAAVLPPVSFQKSYLLPLDRYQIDAIHYVWADFEPCGVHYAQVFHEA